jgi:hypothetical protein
VRYRFTIHDSRFEATLLKYLLTLIGIILAALGGVMVYRALYVEPSAGVVITNSQIRELPNYSRIIVGAALLVGGAALGFFAATRRRG